MPIVYFIVMVLASLLGTITFVVTWRGRRIDDHPICRRCRYDLFGTPEPRTSCPECGAILDRPNATRIGNRQRRPGLAAAGFLLAVAGFGLFGFYAYEKARQTNFNPYKPYWLLRLEATTPALGSKGGALDELLRRAQAGQLSLTQMNALLGDTLTIQTDRGIPWDPTWGDLFWQLHQRGAGTAQQHQQFAESVYAITLEARPEVRLGDELPISIKRSEYRGHGDATHFYYVAQEPTVTIGDASRRLGVSGSGFARGGASTAAGASIHLGRPPFAEIAIGEHKAVISQPYELHVGSSGGPLLSTFEVQREATFEVIPPDVSDVELVVDPQAAAPIEQGLTLRNNIIKINNHGGGVRIFQGTIEATGVNAPFAFDVFARADGKECVIASITHDGQQTNQGWSIGNRVPEGFDAERVDLVFRPSVDVARKSVHVTRIIDHEFVIEDVPIKRP